MVISALTAWPLKTSFGKERWTSNSCFPRLFPNWVGVQQSSCENRPASPGCWLGLTTVCQRLTSSPTGSLGMTHSSPETFPTVVRGLRLGLGLVFVVVVWVFTSERVGHHIFLPFFSYIIPFCTQWKQHVIVIFKVKLL